MIGELNANPDLLEKYVFDFVVVPVLGERSTQMAKKLFCAKTDDQNVKYKAFVAGATGIDSLEQNDKCDLKDFEGHSHHRSSYWRSRRADAYCA